MALSSSDLTADTTQHRTIDPFGDYRPTSAIMRQMAMSQNQLYSGYRQPLTQNPSFPKASFDAGRRADIANQLTQLVNQVDNINPISRVLNAEGQGQPGSEVKNSIQQQHWPDVTGWLLGDPKGAAGVVVEAAKAAGDIAGGIGKTLGDVGQELGKGDFAGTAQRLFGQGQQQIKTQPDLPQQSQETQRAEQQIQQQGKLWTPPALETQQPSLLHHATNIGREVWDQSLGGWLRHDVGPWIDEQMKVSDNIYRLQKEGAVQVDPLAALGESARIGPLGLAGGPGQAAKAFQLKPGASPQQQQQYQQVQGASQQAADLARNVGLLASAVIAAPAVGSVEVASLVPGAASGSFGGVTIGTAAQAGFGLFGLTFLPGLVKSAAAEIQKPTDQNLASVLVNAGNVWLGVVSPIRGLKGASMLSKLTEDGNMLLKNAGSEKEMLAYLFGSDEAKRIATPLLSGRGFSATRGTEDIPIEEKYQQLEQGAEHLIGQLESNGVDLNDPIVKNMISSERTKDALYGQLRTMAGENPEVLTNPAMLKQLAPKAYDQLQQHVKGDWMKARLNIAHQFGYMVSEAPRPFPLTMDAEEQVVFNKIDHGYSALTGVYHAAGNYGIEAASTTPTSAGQALEGSLRAISGPLATAGNEAELGLLQMAKDMGVLKSVDQTSALDRITLRLDNPDEFAKLSPAERVFGRMLFHSWDVMSQYRLQAGHFPVPKPFYTPWKVVYEKGAVGAADDPTHQEVQRILNPDWAKPSNWETSLEEVPATVEGQLSKTGRISVHEARPNQLDWLKQQKATEAGYVGNRSMQAAKAQNQDVISASRKALGTLKQNVTKAENRKAKFSRDYAETKNKLIPSLQIQSGDLDLAMAPLKGIRGRQADRDAIRAEQTAVSKQLRQAEKQLGKLSNNLVEEDKKYKDRNAALEKQIASIENEHGSEVATLVRAENKDLRAIENAHPSGRTLLSGADLIRYMNRRFLLDMHKDSLRRDLMTLADSGVNMVKEWYPGVKDQFLGHELIRPKLKADQLMPEALYGSSFRGEEEAVAAGYRKVLGGRGKKTDLNYQPDIYVRQDIADPMLKAIKDATSIDDLNNVFLKAAMGAVHIGKRAIFLSPVWHAENVGGRALAFSLNDPIMANAAVAKLVHARFSDPAQLAYIKTEAALHGVVQGHRFQVTHHLSRLRDEAHGTHSWPGVIRTVAGMTTHPYNDVIETGFWKAVTDLGIAKYMVEDARLSVLRPDVPAKVRKYAAAEAANQLQGMVNPAYMSKAWRWFRGIASFAPSYWGTYMRSVESTILTKTRATKLAHFLASAETGEHKVLSAIPGVRGAAGKLTNVSPVRLKYLDYKTWRETVRAQASWFDTYMAATLVSADMMNMIGSGHHLWENDQGRYMDINLSNFVHPKMSQSGQEQSFYISGVPLMRQGADIANAMGLGHQWGLGHELNTDDFKKAGAAQKVGMAMGSLLEGSRREGSSKIGVLPEAAGIATLGIDPSAFIREPGAAGVQEVPRIGAFTAMVPGGYAMRQFLHDSRLAEKGSGRTPDPGTAVANTARSVLSQFTGMPSVYYMGNEAPQHISDEKIVTYQREKTRLHDEATTESDRVMHGKEDIFTATRNRQVRIGKQLELDAATFGDSTPAGALSSKYNELQRQYKLNDPTVSSEDFQSNLDNFESQWDKTLQAASPEARAIWWDNVHKNWTDFDYLYSYTRQIKHTLAASIDGQNGEHIAAINAKYAGFYANYPGATVEQAKESDPQYLVYHALLKQMAQDSPMGALISAFTSPYGARVMPPNLTPDQEQAYVDQLPSGTAAMRAGTLQQAAGQAKTGLTSDQARSVGGRLEHSPQLKQQVAQMLQQAGVELSQDSTDADLLAALQQVLGGGQ